MDHFLANIEQYARIMRDVGIIIGVPTAIAVGIVLYKRYIDILKSEIEILKLTQYDQALPKLEAQEKLFELEKIELKEKIEDLQAAGTEKQNEITRLNSLLDKLNYKLKVIKYDKETADKGIKAEAQRKLWLIVQETNYSGDWINGSTFTSGTYGFDVFRSEQDIMEKEGWIEISEKGIRITEDGINAAKK